ncbi:MAG: hypothetical protein LBK22_09045 [Tannerella sp.]|nr:hypothetical protein [Tannerella sp.]
MLLKDGIDRAIAYKLAEKEIDTLQLPVSYRSRQVKNRVALEVEHIQNHAAHSIKPSLPAVARDILARNLS